MATHRIPILGWATVPNAAGEVFFESYDVKFAVDALLGIDSARGF